MGKDKTKAGGHNKHLHSRISFLQQAATYLTIQLTPELDLGKEASPKPSTSVSQQRPTQIDDNLLKVGTPDTVQDSSNQAYPNPSLTSDAAQNENRIPPPPSARLISHLTHIAKKSQIRLDPSIKHQICKRCSTLLTEGSTCRKFIENPSRGGRKAHADVLVVECGVCGGKKRWPVGTVKQGKGKKAVKKLNAHGFEHENCRKVDGTSGESSHDLRTEEGMDR